MPESALECAGAVAWIRFATPTLTAAMAAELADACAVADADQSVRLIVLRGARAGGFVTGARLSDEAAHAAAIAG
ncbi:MAG: hypothetical protein ACREQL_03515, partial [Candidatus Binatia bacterium]